ncbi:hypothetical protein GCM10009748_23230 [Agromyces lapidis]
MSHSPLFNDPLFVADLLDSRISSSKVQAKWGLAKSAVNKYRRRVRDGEQLPSAGTSAHKVASAILADDVQLDSEDRILSAVRMSSTAWGRDDWREFIRAKGQDPDTVTFTYGVTSNPGGGYWNKLLNVRPLAQSMAELFTDADVEAAQKRVRLWKLPTRTPGTGLGAPVAAVLNLADMQLGKSEGGGVEATEQRLYDGLENFQRWVARQRKGGRNIDEVVIVNNGDPGEGIAGNYASQTHTVEKNLRGQMNLVLDVWQAYARNLYPQFDKGQFVSVLCNHMEFGRQGGAKNSITGDSDNGSAFLAETLRRVLSGRSEFDHVEFTIPHDEMNVYTTVAGIPMGFNHGHKIPGSDAAGFEKWLNGQVRGDRQAYEARIWVTAHKHNFQQWEMGSTHVFQCPSCDGGSKWLRDATGRFSRSGILAFLVGEHEPLSWSDPAFL